MRSFLFRKARRYLDYIYRDAVRLRFQAQKDSLRGLGASRFLECGCRAGRKTLRAAEKLPPSVTVGLEYGASFITTAKKRGSKVIQAYLNHPHFAPIRFLQGRHCL